MSEVYICCEREEEGERSSDSSKTVTVIPSVSLLKIIEGCTSEHHRPKNRGKGVERGKETHGSCRFGIPPSPRIDTVHPHEDTPGLQWTIAHPHI